MTLSEIAELLRPNLAKRPLTDSLKFDCGADGMLTLVGDQAVLADQPTDCTIRISTANLNKLIQGNLNPMTAFATGKLKVSGDAGVAMKLGQLLK
jgi:putative sterol carrier protein